MFRKSRWLLIPILVLWGLSFLVVKERNPALTTVGLERLWKGKPWTGLVVGFHKNLRPALLATYLRGQQHGWMITWYPNGQREREQGFRHGQYHGVSQSWYDSGRIKTWRFYENGLADGEQWAWGPEGQVLEYNLYRLDQELAHKTWTFDGKPFHNYVYQNGEKVGIMGDEKVAREAVAQDVQYVVFTVDPEFDTPERLKAFAVAHGVNERNWYFLRGPAVISLIKDTLASQVIQRPIANGRDFVHAGHFYVLDERGRLRGILNGTGISVATQAKQLIQRL